MSPWVKRDGATLTAIIGGEDEVRIVQPTGQMLRRPWCSAAAQASTSGRSRR